LHKNVNSLFVSLWYSCTSISRSGP